MFLILSLSIAALSGSGVPAAEVARPENIERPAVATHVPGPATAVGATEKEIRTLILGLNAPRLSGRQQATRQLAAVGTAAVPYLVAALGDESCEVRVRASVLLSQQDGLAAVAPHLVAAVEKPYGLRARELLRDRALAHIEAACQAPQTEKLFKLWGTSVAAYRERVWRQFTEVQTSAEAGQAVAPLLSLPAKTTRFSKAVAPLDAVPLAYENAYDPGAAIVQTLARGLDEDRDGWVAFAEQYIQAVGRLVAELKSQRMPPQRIRRELLDRVNMSQGAVQFLVEILDGRSLQRAVLTQRIGLSPSDFTEEFCRGLASPEQAAFERGVGRTHIVDMLTETLRKWPETPTGEVVDKLVARTTDTARSGDKPKALAFLDALEACRDLGGHRLDVHTGLGKQLAERLYRAAADSPNVRTYSPVRRLHDRLVALAERGISPAHDAFPRQLLEDHLRGEAAATSDEQLLALERYVRCLDRLQAAGVSLEQPGVSRFIRLMRDRLSTRHDVIAVGVTRVDQLLGPPRSAGSKIDGAAIDRALGEWTDNAAVP
jgi:hypothetical protein